MLILGLNAYHGDSAACILRDGELLAAAEEERFRRIKHWAGLPTEAIKYCLQEAGATLSQVDHIAVNRQPGINNFKRLKFILVHRPDIRLVINRLRSRKQSVSIDTALHNAFPEHPPKNRCVPIEHHLAHLASAFFVSPFQEAVCLSIDGFGDFASAAWGFGDRSSGDRASGLQEARTSADCDAPHAPQQLLRSSHQEHAPRTTHYALGTTQITIHNRIFFPHSLGIFYSALTQYLGFPYFGDEYKVMGLAPYGKPVYLDDLRQLVKINTDGTYELGLKFFRHHTENVAYTWDGGCPEVGTLYSPALEQLLGPARKKGDPLEQRHKDIARSTQAMYEEAFFALLNKLHAHYQCPNLALAGGCAMNSVANGKVYLQTPFRRMYLPAAAGDAGGAIGAAMIVNEAERGSPKPPLSDGKFPGFGRQQLRTSGDRTSVAIAKPRTQFEIRNSSFEISPFLGPSFADADIARLLQERCDAIAAARCKIEHVPSAEALCLQTATAVAEGKVVGWFQGRMEWGPRALGNRSILGDPRRADMKDILNQKIKRRESFRPFAPSILREAVPDWFEQDDDVPFMMQVFQIRPEKRALIPAVTHVDGSGRLQTVHRETNPFYYQLIEKFRDLTGVPLVLNTSFNENEPVVCRPEEALDCFLRTSMDFLVLGTYVVRR